MLQPLGDPMASEVIAIPTRGVERWLTQRLSHRLGTAMGRADGVCANVEFPFPGVLVGAATAAACGFDRETDPWPPERSVWPLLELVDDHLRDDWLAPLAAHLRAASPTEQETPRRFSTVRHLADLFDQYAVHRPDMVLGWASGRFGEGTDVGWQGELWRRLRERIGVPSPAERFDVAATRLAADREILELPARLSLFGLTRLPASQLRVLEAIAELREVHLFLLHPSGALWEKVADLALPADSRRVSIALAPQLPANPLLRSWGRDSREMQMVLMAHGVLDGEHRAVPAERSTLLGLIQADVRADRRPPGSYGHGSTDDPRPFLAADDDSVRIHSCHGRARQVEVMRDAVLHLLAADATLEPRDVIMMCPDIESFAPLVQAAFGTDELAEDDGARTLPAPPSLRVRLADRALRQTNPLLAVAANVLELAGSRVTASQVLDLASREPVARRFRFSEDDLSQVERWVAGAGIRWGLDAAQRAPWKLERVRDNTWAFGLDRLLLGVAMAEDGPRLFGGALPLDDVESSSVELAGRLAELVNRLAAALANLSGVQAIEGWASALVAGTESIALAASTDSWQHDQLHRLLDDVVGDKRTLVTETLSPVLDLTEVTSLLEERLRGRPSRANFRTGDLTICTLVPMRSVPHRVVCIMGLDDGVFPRRASYDGDDLLLDDPHVGDRDSRSEDRQLILDALLAAEEHLVISYEGKDQRTNQERPPAVPVSELLDVIDRTVRVEDSNSKPRDLVVVDHPLQPFDRRNFIGGELCPGQPWSFDPVNLDGARSLSRASRPRRSFLSHPLAELEVAVVPIESLVRFAEHPVKSFLRTRLGYFASEGPDEVRDSLPVDLDGLEKWAAGDRLLSARLSGTNMNDALVAELARGLLPVGPLADVVARQVGAYVDALMAAVDAQACAGVAPAPVEVNVDLGDGSSVVGTIAGVRQDAILRCVYSRLGAKHRLAAWVRFLALSAARPDLTVSAVTIGRGESKPGGTPRVIVAELAPFHGEAASRQAAATASLRGLVELYRRGMREPLPLYCETSAAWADAARREDDTLAAAVRKWESNNWEKREDAEPEHVAVLGPQRSLADVLVELPPSGECGSGWREAEETRLGRLALRLWDELLDHERLATP